MDRKAFESTYKELCDTVAGDLFHYGLKVFDAMTEEERAQFSDNTSYRLPKAIVVAITDDGRVNDQFNAEAIKPLVKRLRRIIKSRYV